MTQPWRGGGEVVVGDVFNTRCTIFYHKQTADKIKAVCVVCSVDSSLMGPHVSRSSVLRFISAVPTTTSDVLVLQSFKHYVADEGGSGSGEGGGGGMSLSLPTVIMKQTTVSGLPTNRYGPTQN